MYATLRKQMVQKYVIEAGIKDPGVIEAMLRVPRHFFVEKALEYKAYRGSSLPIGFGQTISHPTTVALMTQALEISGDEKVLEIGTGSGYQAAILAQMGVKVYSIERIPELAAKARSAFERMGLYSIAVKIGDGHLGWPQFAPFDRIILTAHSEQIPPPLIDQLAAGGILIMPMGKKFNQKLTRFRKDEHGKIRWEIISDVHFVPLIKKQRRF